MDDRKIADFGTAEELLAVAEEWQQRQNWVVDAADATIVALPVVIVPVEKKHQEKKWHLKRKMVLIDDYC